MKLGYKSMGIIVVALFVVGIGAASIAGYWKTESTKEPVKIKEGDFAGMPNPSDIRGSYTWADVAKAFNVDVQHLLKAFGANDPLLKVNTLETIYGGAGLPEGTEIGTDSVRLFVSLLTGLPHVPEESTILPIAAIEVLRAEGKGAAELIEEAAAKAWKQTPPASAEAVAASNPAPVPATSAAAAAPQTQAAPVPTTVAPAAPKAAPVQPAAAVTADPAATTTTVHSPSPTSTGSGTGEGTGSGSAPGSVTGKTSFKDLKSWGLSEEQIKSVTGGKIGPDLASIRDWATANGLEFSGLKSGLQALLDARK